MVSRANATVLKKEMIDGENNDIQNSGNRDNTINTTCRVCPYGYISGNVFVDPSNQNEVSIIGESGHGDSWLLDDVCDEITAENTLAPNFISQKEMFSKVFIIYACRTL